MHSARVLTLIDRLAGQGASRVSSVKTQLAAHVSSHVLTVSAHTGTADTAADRVSAQALTRKSYAPELSATFDIRPYDTAQRGGDRGAPQLLPCH